MRRNRPWSSDDGDTRHARSARGRECIVFGNGRTSTTEPVHSEGAPRGPEDVNTRFPAPADLPLILELPDPFRRADGQRVATRQQWRRQRNELLRSILHYQYGSLPPVPRTVTPASIRTKTIRSIRATERSLRLTMGRGDAVQTDLVLTIPDARGDAPFATIVRGDLGWGPVTREIAAAVVERGYILAEFNREQIACDGPARDGVYRAYPEFDGGRIAAWAWGFHRVVDYLHALDIVDPARIAVTGHSRGDKAALLAGAIDERIALTAPNDSGCGGAGCYRLQAPKSETLAHITKAFPYWFHPRLREFVGQVERLPFDQHTLKALVAPRALLGTEALGDLWANPKGAQQSHTAAREVFAFLGASDRIGIRFRAGGHEHNLDDWTTLLDFADWQFFGKSPFGQCAFAGAERGYSWRAPARMA